MNTQVIGYVGENGTRDVQIPVGHLLEKWPDLSPSILMVPVGGADDDAYPVDSELVGSDLVWHVSAADTAVTGTTKASVRMTASDGRVALDEPFTVIVSQNLSAGGTPPSPIQPWVDKLAELAPRAEKAADDAAKAANRANDAAKNWEEGTAANSSLLANKPPEYYTWSNNLLYNSNFESLYLVNHLGYASGSAVSPWGEFINCWVNANDAEKAFTLSDDGISMPANTTIWQIANRVSDGDTVTIAVCDGNGDIYAASGTVHFNSDESWYRCVTVNGNNFDLYADTYNGDFEFIIWAANDVKIKWAVLYKGAYTADTLPQPQWLHPRLEMIRMGLETQPVNLLDNSDFTNPVNQRGLTSYTAAGYTIDRWISSSSNPLTVGSAGITLDSSGSDSALTITQYVAGVRDGTYTLACCTTVGTTKKVSTRIVAFSGNTVTTVDGTNAAYEGGYISAAYSSKGYAVLIRSLAGYSVTFEWIALYEGTYTAETLPPYVPKGYAVELAACERYYQRYKLHVPQLHGSTAMRRYVIPYRTKFRLTPTVTIISATEYNLATADTGATFIVNTTSDEYTRLNANGDVSTVSGLFAGIELEASADL